MHATFRLPALAGVFLLVWTPFAGAETPTPDPIAPAVMGRPLDETWTVKPARKKPVAQKQVAPKPKRAQQEVVANSKAATVPARPVAAVPSAPVHATAVMGNARPVARVQFGPPVFSSKDQELVRKYYEANPAAAHPSNWKVGERVPERAQMTGVPRDVRSALSALPPGHQYVQLDGEVVLVAVQSRTVVDGVSRRP